MTTREKVELGLIPCAGLAAAAARPLLPAALPLGEAILVGAALLLGQGLIRDLYLKYVAHAGQACQVDYSTGKAVSMCMESTLGILAIGVGAALLGSGVRTQLECAGWFWPGFVLVVGLAGFAMKDVVIDLKARRVRLEKDHRNVVLW
jgi:hypothetical protein